MLFKSASMFSSASAYYLYTSTVPVFHFFSLFTDAFDATWAPWFDKNGFWSIRLLIDFSKSCYTISSCSSGPSLGIVFYLDSSIEVLGSDRRLFSMKLMVSRATPPVLRPLCSKSRSSFDEREAAPPGINLLWLLELALWPNESECFYCFLCYCYIIHPIYVL